MESESGAKGFSSNAGDSYIGSFISLVSKTEIRYEGVLYFLNVHDSTIGLNNVRSYGTEGRKKDGPQIPPGDKVYEYILFRGGDIKDLQVKSPPPAQTEEQIHNDPAIIQSHYAGMPLNSPPLASVGGKTLTESTQWQDTPALTSRAYPDALPSYQSVSQVGQLDHSATTQIAGSPSSSMPMYWQGYNGTAISISHDPQHLISFQHPSRVSFPLTMQNQMQAPEIRASTTLTSPNTSEFGKPVSSSIASAAVHPNFSPSLTAVQCTPVDMSSSSSIKSSLPHSASMTANRPTLSLFPSSCQDINVSEAQIVGKAVSDPRSVLPVQSMPYPASSFVGQSMTYPTSGPFLTPPSLLLAPDQLAQSRPYALSSMPKLDPGQSDMGAPTLAPSNSSALISIPVSQAPLLPLPTSAQQSKYLDTQYTEEFDFIAMNEKFKKDDVWGYLGKAKDKIEGVEDHAIGQNLGDRDGHGLIPNPKPAYNKDEFFDTISCNALSRGARNGQHRFSERMKLDTETFGNFQQRFNLGYGGYGAGRGENYRGSYNMGRGYGYGGRGRGGNMPF